MHTKPAVIVCILLILSSSVVAQITSWEQKVDSAQQIINSEVNDSTLLATQIHLSRYYYNLRKMDSSKLYAEKSVSLAEKTNDQLVQAYIALGYAQIRFHEMDEARAHLRKANKLAMQQKDTANAVYALSQIATSFLFNTYDSCIYYAVEALKMAKKPENIIPNLRSMALAHQRNGNIEKAIEVQREAIAYAYDNPSSINPVVLKYNLAGFYYGINLDSSKAIYQEILDHYEAESDIPGKLIVMGNLASIEYAKKNYQKAIDINLEVLEERRKHKINTSNGRVVFSNLSINYRMLGKYEQAKAYLDSAKAIIFPVNDIVAINRYYESRFLLDSLSGDFPNAITTLQEHMAYRDSMTTKENNEKYNELLTQYETEKKDQEIESLKQESEIQSLTISQRNNQIIATISVVILLIAGILYYFKQSRDKQERKANELQQRFLRSQLNPHFIFNSMTAIQQYVIEYDAQGASDYMGMFSTLMRQILENSRQEFIPLSEEKSMLTNYLELQKLRFKGGFDYSIEIDEELDEDYIGLPPMFAQPFIENSLEHGLFKKDDVKNEIKISFTQEAEDLIRLDIEDTGVGNKAQNEDKEHNSLSTIITGERLYSMSKGTNSKIGMNSFNIQNENGDILGYKIRLTLPSRLVLN